MPSAARTNPPTAATKLSVDHVNMVFTRDGKSTPVLADINLTVHDGEFICLVVPSGCGKSTLLNTMAGFLSPTSGTIRIDNGRIAAIGERKHGHGRSTLVMPALVNAHDHARAVRSSSFGAGGKPLETWLHYMAMLPAVDPYLATAVSLSLISMSACSDSDRSGQTIGCELSMR